MLHPQSPERNIRTAESFVISQKHRYYREYRKQSQQTQKSKNEGGLPGSLKSQIGVSTNYQTIYSSPSLAKIDSQDQLRRNVLTDNFFSSKLLMSQQRQRNSTQLHSPFDKVSFKTQENLKHLQSTNSIQCKQFENETTISQGWDPIRIELQQQESTPNLAQYDQDITKRSMFFRAQKKQLFATTIGSRAILTNNAVIKAKHVNAKQKSSVIEKMKKREEDRKQRALDFRNKHSIVYQFYQDVANPKDIKFCEEIVNSLKDMEEKTGIIPFSVSIKNMDNLPLSEIQLKVAPYQESEAVKKAKQIVKNCKERAKDHGIYHDIIQVEMKQLKKLKYQNVMRQLVDHMRSVNYQGEEDFENNQEEQKRVKEEIFEGIKGNKLDIVIKILDKDPTQVNMADENLMTPLHWAVKRNYISVAETLIQRGAYRNAQDILGRTPLHIAAKYNLFEMTKLLLRYKANLNMTNKKKLTPHDVAASDDVTNLLNKAKRFEVLRKMSIKPSKGLLDAEYLIFKPCYAKD